MKILTSYWAKPIPFRHYDWEATLDNYEAGHPIGFGATEADAIADLKEQIEENEPLCPCGAFADADGTILHSAKCPHGGAP